MNDMDFPQAVQRIVWLDEERKRDKDQVLKAQQQLDKQGMAITEHAMRLQEVEEQIRHAVEQVARLQRLEEPLRQVREEIELIKDREERRKTSEEESLRIRHIEREREKQRDAELEQALARLSSDMESLHNRLLRSEDQCRRLDTISQTLQVAEEERHEFYAEQTKRDQIEEQRWRRQHAEWAEQVQGYAQALEAAEDRLRKLEQQGMAMGERADRLQASIEEQRKRAEQHVASIRLLEDQHNVFLSRLAELHQRLEGCAHRFEDHQEKLTWLDDERKAQSESLLRLSDELRDVAGALGDEIREMRRQVVGLLRREVAAMQESLATWEQVDAVKGG